MVEMHPFLQRALRYGLVGVLNGIVCLTLVEILDLRLQVRPDIANALGYALGILLNFSLARTFVFRSESRATRTGPRYLAVVAAGFAMNQIVLHLMLRLLGTGALPHAVAQLSGIATYTVFVFLACQVWVFRTGQGLGSDADLSSGS
jgi:putative flippase GtrA